MSPTPLIRLISCVLLAWALCRPAPAASASAAGDGLVIRAAPLGEAGLQADVAALSPRLSRSGVIGSAPGLNPGAEGTSWRAYTVQPGDTMSAIALRFGVPVTWLVAQNGLANAELIRVGLVLQVPAGLTRPPLLPQRTLPASGPWEQVHLWPWPPAQGQTLVIRLWAREPLSHTLVLAGQPMPMTVDGSRAWALIPFAALEAPGQKLLAVTAGGATVTISVPISLGIFASDEIPASASDPILSQAGLVQAELVRLTALFSRFTSGEWTPASRFRSPLAASAAGRGDYLHTSPFGSRRTYGGEAGVSAHTGEDYSAPPGTPVLAPAAGVVVLAEPLFVRGNAVIVDHGSGVFTGYWHLQAIGVRAGERVEPGHLLGEVGSTGLSTGAHLHWELRINGVAVDPLQWLEP